MVVLDCRSSALLEQCQHLATACGGRSVLSYLQYISSHIWKTSRCHADGGREGSLCLPRPDVVALWRELEEARNTLAQVQALHLEVAERSRAYHDRMHAPRGSSQHTPLQEKRRVHSNVSKPAPFVRKTPPSRGSQEKTPPSQGSQEKTPSSQGSWEKTPSSQGSQEKTPPSQGSWEKTPSSQGSWEKTLSSQGSWEKTPSSQGSQEKTPPSQGSWEKTLGKKAGKRYAPLYSLHAGYCCNFRVYYDKPSRYLSKRGASPEQTTVSRTGQGTSIGRCGNVLRGHTVLACCKHDGFYYKGRDLFRNVCLATIVYTPLLST